MKTKIELAHEYLLRFSGATVADAWDYVDAMQVEADKRDHKDRVIPDGFVVVPEEPTERMLDSAYISISDNLHNADLENIYKAMIWSAQELTND